MRNTSRDEVTPQKEVDWMGGRGGGGPHLSGYFFENGEFFPFLPSFHKVNGLFSTRTQFFENGLQSGFFFLLRTPLIRHTAKGKGSYGISFVIIVFAWKGKNSCVHVFFRKRRKKSPYSKIFGYVWTWTRPNYHIAVYLLPSTPLKAN